MNTGKLILGYLTGLVLLPVNFIAAWIVYEDIHLKVTKPDVDVMISGISSAIMPLELIIGSLTILLGGQCKRMCMTMRVMLIGMAIVAMGLSVLGVILT